MKIYIKYILKPKSILILIFLLVMLTLLMYYSFVINHVNITDDDSTTVDLGYLIKTPGCRIPEMYIHGPRVDEYMTHNYDNLNCKSWKYTLPLITSNLTSLKLNMSAWATLNIARENPTFKCYYTSIERPKYSNDYYYGYNEDQVKIGEKIYFKDSITVPNEMVEVICTLRDTIIYKNYHIFIRPKQAVIKRVSGNVSILILGLDSVSRINFHRRMPKTNAILSQLGNIEFLGYNKIDDNTYPNLISVLSGMSAAELKKNCWLNENDYFDRCSFVWDEFKDADFGTAFVEDSPGIGLFNYLKRGFVNKPTDHYLRPLMVRAEQSIGHTSYPVGNTKVCIGDKLSFATVLDHTLKIALSMSDRLYMNFAWTTSLTHDTMEYPLCGDDELSEFLITLEKSGELNHTILIVMSDHGMRWGNFRSTYQGGLEDRLPILKFVMPEWFKSTYRRAVKNLKINSRRLTTPYDLHETLLDLVNVKQLDDDTTGRRTEEARALGNATRTSLFLEIPLNRTCSSSGIPVHYCACHNPGKTLAVNNVNAVRAADALMRQLNLMLLNFTVCANLTLLQVDSVVVETGRETNKVNDYQLQVTTLPGLAKFEATVREYHNEFSLVGSVSRLNVYGNQSYCVNDPNIKLICYCKRQKA